MAVHSKIMSFIRGVLKNVSIGFIFSLSSRGARGGIKGDIKEIEFCVVTQILK